jgi:hypothetical protein
MRLLSIFFGLEVRDLRHAQLPKPEAIYQIEDLVRTSL